MNAWALFDQTDGALQTEKLDVFLRALYMKHRASMHFRAAGGHYTGSGRAAAFEQKAGSASGCGESAAPWAESYPRLGDFHPLSMHYGGMVMLDGNRCHHFNKQNVEEPQCTRVSFDFRAMMRETYAASVEQADRPSISFTTKRKFIIGSHFTTMQADAKAPKAA